MQGDYDELGERWPGLRAPRITAKDLRGRLNSTPPPVLLDVRTPNEFTDGRVVGAINILHDQLPARATHLAAHKARDIVIYCRGGARAGHAARALYKCGFIRPALLRGHMQGWRGAGHPVHRG